MPWRDGADVEAFWLEFARACLDWLARTGVPARDAVVLLPFAQHLVLARRAFAAQCAWPPRLETTRSLASALAPQSLAAPGQLSGDAAVDTLTALGRLQSAGLLAAVDQRGQRVRAERVHALASALRQAADAQHPAERSAYWTHAGTALTRSGGEPLETALRETAWLWAQEGPEPATDALFRHPAGAWVVLEAGRPDRLAQAVATGGVAPCLRVALGVPEHVTPPAWTQATLADGAALAHAAAAHVVAAVARGEVPVLLPATDRALVRRVLALLAPYGLAVADETGVSLATQAPAAALRHLLRAALQGGMDDALAWAKGPLAPPSVPDLDALEAWARRRRQTHWRGAAPDRAPASAWRCLAAAAAPLREGPGRRPLGAWLSALRDTLLRCEALGPERWPSAEQPAWRLVGEALWLTRSPWPGSAVAHAMRTPLSGAAWLAWLDDALQAPAPSRPGAQAAQVVITPPGRALLRPFAHCVLAGCDAARWATGPTAPSLVDQATARALNLPDRLGALEAQWQALVQSLRLRRTTWLHAGHEGGVALEWAPPLQRLRALWGGADLPAALEARTPDQPEAAPMARQAQTCGGWLPERLSASQVEALRECPYRFFGRVRLALGRDEEIDLDPDARDWGRWLHAVLERAHALGDPAQTWELACDQVLDEQGLPPGAEAPFRALLQRWGPAYLAWWAAQAGTAVIATEKRLSGHPWPDDAVLASVGWTGVIDRLDATPNGERRLLDFKAGSSAGVVERLKDDTQLPFYAVLMALADEPVDAAAYLAYESKSGGLRTFAPPEAPPNPPLAERAETLRRGLADDFRALRAGEPLRALGEGRACDHCEMRGICRRHDWQS